MSKLTERFEKMKMQLKTLLQEQKHICVTCDIWSARGRSFIGMTAHYISPDYQRKSFALAFREIAVKQNYKNLAKIMSDIFEEFELPTNKITNIVTDGGSAYCKAFRIYGSRDDTAQPIGDAIDLEDEDEEDGELNADLPFMHDMGEYFVSNIVDFDVIDSVEEFLNDNDEYGEQFANDEFSEDFIEEPQQEEEEEMITLPPQRRCISHKLNLISGDFEKELTGNAKSLLVQSISKLHALWVLVGRSTAARKICTQILGCSLKTPCITRWNSKFDAVNQIFKLKPKINLLIQELKPKLKSASSLNLITSNDWIVIEEYIKIFTPVATALDKLQGEKNGCQGFIVPTLMAMRHHIVRQNCRQITHEFKNAMLKVIDNRFNGYFQITNDNRELLIASASLPRFKTNSFESEENKRFVKDLLIEECRHLSDNVDTIENDENGTTADAEKDDFFVSFESSSSRRSSIDDIVESEVNRYLNDHRTNIEILDEYPLIRNVFFRYNTTLSASAAVERLFSQCMIIFAPRRNRLSSENFERALLLKQNHFD